MKFQIFVAGVVSAFLASMSTVALAQQANAPAAAEEEAPATVEDIVVTARRTSERLQDVPIAISVVSRATLEFEGHVQPG